MRVLPRLLMLVSLAAPLAHAELLDDVHQRGALRIALEGTYPPFNFKQGGKLTGFETELGELLAAELAVKPEFVTTEWSGILAGLQSGKYDIALNQVSVNEQRRKVFDFSEPYTISSAQLIVRADETRQFKSLEDLKDKMSDTERQQLEDAIKATEAAMAGEDVADIEAQLSVVGSRVFVERPCFLDAAGCRR